MHDDPAELHAGDRVALVAVPQILKTAEPLPMLRPPNLLAVGDRGTLLGRKPGNTWAVRFDRGAYLIGQQYLRPLPPDPLENSPGA